jgi:hypothetical protein
VSKTVGLWVARMRLRPAILCVGITLLPVANGMAQNPQDQQPAANLQEQRAKEGDLYNLEHYVHAVPKAPEEYHSITPDGRLGWFVRSTIGPKSLVGGLFTAGIGTAENAPHEYGPHWDGFAQRYGMRMTGIATSNAMEAGLGAIWGEDPRYFHTVNHGFTDRVKNVTDLTFRAYREDGQRHIAFARFMAVIGSNFLSNTWRVDSEANWNHALVRSAEGFGGRFLSNAVSEFVPQLWRVVRHKPSPYPADSRNP